MKRPRDSFEPRASSHESDGSASAPSPFEDSSPSGGESPTGARDGGGQTPIAPDTLDDLVILEPGPTAHDLGLELPEDPDEARAFIHSIREIIVRRLAERRSSEPPPTPTPAGPPQG